MLHSILLSFLLSFWSGNTTTHTLTIKVDGMEKLEGKLMLRLSDSEGKVLKKFTHPVDEKVEVIKLDLAAGTYVLACFHDENDNDKIDKGFTGIPTEKYAFSNNARGIFGPPDLADQAFELKSASTQILHLKWKAS